MDLYFRKYGTGPPLVILHGLLGSSANWQAQGRYLGDRFSVYVPDLRNHGRSPHSPAMGVTDMVDDIRRFFRAQGIDRAHLLGHSLGGTLAMQFASQHPDRVDQLVIVDMAPGSYPETGRFFFNYLSGLDLSVFDTYRAIDTAMSVRISNTAERQLMLHNIVRNKNREFVWRVNIKSMMSAYDSFSRTVFTKHCFENPTLFVHGTCSDYLKATDARKILTCFPGARILPVQGAGHWVHSDAPEQFNAIVSRFLKRAA